MLINRKELLKTLAHLKECAREYESGNSKEGAYGMGIKYAVREIEGVLETNSL
jgi:hypothetical protein